MSSGHVLLWIAAASALVSLVSYLRCWKDPQQSPQSARYSFITMAAALAIATGMLFQALLTHQFNLEYVYNYSSNDLSPIYTISAFWAGQEGTFLLWALLGAILGIFFLRKSGPDETIGMIVLNTVQLFILVLMLKKSPFVPVSAEVTRHLGLSPGAPIPEGNGLNLLLQDFWMAIHPPLVFLGYAALAVPFAMALSALGRKDDDHWVTRALPWTLFAWVTLGSGIFVGGFWAYKVLGWGGFWGWDPVENASLIPWLTATALLHGMLVQKAVKGMRRTNLFLAIITFLLILYGTFLTRSGVLGDSSVHAFSDLGLNGYLIFFLLSFSVLSLGALWRRWKEIPNADTSLYSSSRSREFAFLLGVIVLSVFGMLVLVGTSSPLITGLMAKMHWLAQGSNVETSYYLWISAPIAVAIGLLAALGPILTWKGHRSVLSSRSLMVILIASFGCGVSAGLISTKSDILSKTAMILVIMAGAFAVGTNLVLLSSQLNRQKILSCGSYLAHMGLGLLLIGAITSSVYSHHHRIDLARGEKKSMLGQQFSFMGLTQDQTSPNRFTMDVRVDSADQSFIARPVFEENLRTGEIMRKPHIQKSWLSDLYFIPQAYQQPADPSNFEVIKGQEPVQIGDYQIRFIDYQTSEHAMASQMSVGALLEVTHQGQTERVVPEMQVGSITRSIPAKIANGTASIQLKRISVENHSVILGLKGPGLKSSPEIAVFEVSTKPLINLVWLGTIFMIFGGCLAAIRRAKEATAGSICKSEKERPGRVAKKKTATH